jgi:hypothetical protein
VVAPAFQLLVNQETQVPTCETGPLCQISFGVLHTHHISTWFPLYCPPKNPEACPPCPPPPWGTIESPPNPQFVLFLTIVALQRSRGCRAATSFSSHPQFVPKPPEMRLDSNRRKHFLTYLTVANHGEKLASSPSSVAPPQAMLHPAIPANGPSSQRTILRRATNLARTSCFRCGDTRGETG